MIKGNPVAINLSKLDFKTTTLKRHCRIRLAINLSKLDFKTCGTYDTSGEIYL